MRMISAHNKADFFPKKFEIYIFIAILRFTMKNAFKWVQTSQVLVE